MTKNKEPLVIVGSHYFSQALTCPSKLVAKARTKLKRKRFDVIACTGMSGLAFGPVLAYSLRKRLLIVRKEADISAHSTSMIEGFLRKGDRVLLIDDFTSSGATRERMRTAIAEKLPSIKIIGMYLYKYDEYEAIK